MALSSEGQPDLEEVVAAFCSIVRTLPAELKSPAVRTGLKGLLGKAKRWLACGSVTVLE